MCARAYAAAVLLRALAAGRAASLVPDGAVELQTARALADGRWADALDTHFHPLFALLVAPLARAGLPAEGAAVVLTVLVSSLVAPLAAWTAARLSGPGALRAAACAGLLAAAQPWLVRLGGQVMAYGAAHAALALALALGVLAARRTTLAAGLAAGGAVGLGWLARSDALATGAGLGLALLVGAARRGGPAGALRLAAGLVVGALVVMSPYLVAMRAHTGEWRLSLKKRVDQVVRLPDALVAPADGPAQSGQRSGQRSGQQSGPALRDLVQAELTGGDVAAVHQGARDTRPPLLEAAWVAARKGASAAHPLLLALAGLGLLVAARPGRWLAPAALASFVAAHALLKANWGYTSVLHQSALGVLVAPLAGVGAAWLWPRLPRPPARHVLGLLALLALVLKALEPQQRGKAAERAVGPFLRADAGPGPLLIAGHDARVVAHDAGAAYLDLRDVPGPPAQAVASLRARGARYLVVFLRRRDAPPDGGAPRLEAALAPLGVTPLDASFRGEGEGAVSYDWRLFRIDPHPGGPAAPGGP